MRYISDDGKVFNSEMECLEHEKKVKEKNEQERLKAEQERLRKEKLEKEKQDRCNSIIKHNKELLYEIKEFEKDYGINLLNSLPLEYLYPFNIFLLK